MDTTQIPATATKQCFFDQTRQEFVDDVDPESGKGVYSGKSKEDLASQYKTTIVVMDWKDAIDAADRKHITPVTRISADQYDYFLNCLPPVDWIRNGPAEHFYLCERVSDNIVQYCVHMQGRFYKFQDRAGMKTIDIVARVKAGNIDGDATQPLLNGPPRDR